MKINIKGAGIQIAAVRLVAMPLALINSTILARFLGPDGYGQYVFLISVASLFGLAIGGGLPQLLTKEVALLLSDKKIKEAKKVVGSFSIFIWLACFFSIIASCAFMWFNGKEVNNEFIFLLSVIPFYSLYFVYSGALRGAGKSLPSIAPQILFVPVIQLILVYCFKFYYEISSAAAVLFYSAAYLFSCIFCWFFWEKTTNAYNGHISYNSFRWVRYFFRKFSFKYVAFSFNSILFQFNGLCGVVVLSYISNKEEVGFYQIADRGSQLAGLALGVVELVMAAGFAKEFQERNIGKIKSMLMQGRIISTFGALIFMALFVIYGEFIIKKLYGVDYIEGVYGVLIILTAAHIFRSIFGPVLILLSMAGHEKYIMIIQAIALFTNIFITYFLGSIKGAEGASWGMMASSVFGIIGLYFGVKIFILKND